MQEITWLYNVGVGLFVLNASSLVILFIGWLTHANYYDKMCKALHEFAIIIHISFTFCLSFLGIISYFFENDPVRLFQGTLITNGLYLFGMVVFVTMVYVVEYIIKLHNYFGNKRGL